MWKTKDHCRWGNFLLLNLQKKLAWIIKKAKRLEKAIITFDDHRWSCRI